MRINNIIQSKSNKWLFYIDIETRQGNNVLEIELNPRSKGYSYLNRNFEYFVEYKGYVTTGILFKIENSFPRAVFIKNKYKKPWKLNEHFKQSERFIKPERDASKDDIRHLCNLV
jgi:hypothetical protein